jgi:acetylornithine/succinyldiaminopimelate/putrescine aminotransferase
VLRPPLQQIAALVFFLNSQSVEIPVIPAGTRVDARLESSVHTADSNVGDAIVAVVVEPIRAAGQIIVPQGSRLNGRVETIQPATSTNEGRVRLVFREIQLSNGRTISTWITNSFSASPPKRKLRYVLAMGIGAAAGAVIGGKAARTTGITGGTLVGFIIATNYGGANLPDLTLRAGQVLHLQLGEDLQLK